MKTTTILGILLLGSLTLNYFLWRETERSEDGTTVEPTCYATRGFERQTPIDNGLSRGFVGEYKNSLLSPDSIIGGIITRSAFDEMLCTQDCNAISYTFGRDSLGRTGPGGNGVFVIFSGLNVTYDSTTNKITEYKDLGINKYVARHWCPPVCSPF